jgi:MinD superfamily P-loop ATPase
MGTIPFDKTVEEATRNAKPVIDYDCKAALAVKNIWEQAKQKLNLSPQD